MIQFQTALEVLSDAEVEFVVVGDLCALFHGSTRGTTYALEVCCSQSESNLERLTSTLARFRPA